MLSRSKYKSFTILREKRAPPLSIRDVSASFFIGLFHDKPYWDWCVTGSLCCCDWQAFGLPNMTSRARAKGNHLTCLLKRFNCTHTNFMHL